MINSLRMFNVNRSSHSLCKAISNYEVPCHGRGQRVRWRSWSSIQVICHFFHIHQTNSWDRTISRFELENRSRSWVKSKVKVTYWASIQPMYFLFVSCIAEQPHLRYDQKNIWPSNFIVQTSTFLFISATAMALDQGHRKVIECISSNVYCLCSKYLRFSSKDFDVRSKGFCGGHGGLEADAETDWKYEVTPGVTEWSWF